MSQNSISSRIHIPDYTLGEEIFNAISHGIGALLSILALILMILKAQTPSATVYVCLFGGTSILLYTVSCIYHALSRNVNGKRVLRVIDHINVFLLVFGTYIPVALLAVKGALGWVLFGVIAVFTTLGVTFTAINVDRYSKIAVACHLICGWSILVALPRLFGVMGNTGVLTVFLGGVMYSVGSVLYGLGKKTRYMHSVFHIFCLLGTFFHFLGIYRFIL